MASGSFLFARGIGFTWEELLAPGGEFTGYGSNECHALSARWVGKAKLSGVKHESAGLGLLAGDLGVDRVTKNRAAEVEHVDTDLMGSASVEVTVDE